MNLPIYIGILGVISVKRLLQISRRIGVGNSARFLRKQPGLMGRTLRLGGYRTDELISDLTSYMEDQRYNIAGCNINTFNQVQSTERWRMKTLKSFGSTPTKDGSHHDR
jgi:methylenetetrahydrofolate reductase (NADPH)